MDKKKEKDKQNKQEHEILGDVTYTHTAQSKRDTNIKRRYCNEQKHKFRKQKCKKKA